VGSEHEVSYFIAGLHLRVGNDTSDKGKGAADPIIVGVPLDMMSLNRHAHALLWYPGDPDDDKDLCKLRLIVRAFDIYILTCI